MSKTLFAPDHVFDDKIPYDELKGKNVVSRHVRWRGLFCICSLT